MQPGHAKSLAPLALLAMQETGADGYVLYRHSLDGGAPVALCSWGMPVPDRSQNGLTVAAFPLRKESVLVATVAFVFRAPAISEGSRSVLERLARTIESVWSLSGTPDTLVQLARRISQLQAELADLKIADRISGFLKNPEPNATEIIARHVEGVVETRRLQTLLEQSARDLEFQISERKLIAEAKALLQRSYGLSEEEAYTRLRLSSRRSRRRLGEVAQQLIERVHDSSASPPNQG